MRKREEYLIAEQKLTGEGPSGVFKGYWKGSHAIYPNTGASPPWQDARSGWRSVQNAEVVEVQDCRCRTPQY